VTVIHAKAGTTGPDRTARLNAAFHYGMYRFYRKHYARDHSPAMNGLVYAGIGAKLAASVVGTWFHRLGRAARGAG
jgi:predicted secreted protein